MSRFVLLLLLSALILSIAVDSAKGQTVLVLIDETTDSNWNTTATATAIEKNNVTTTTAGSFTSDLDDDDDDDYMEEAETVEESWAPILVSAALTSLQIAIFLLIFEVGRRHPLVRSVYDRRRILWPHRVPPPLMQEREWSWCFEWWRIQLTNRDYMELAKEEAAHMKYVLEEKKEQQLFTRDQFLIRAEQECWEQSPYGLLEKLEAEENNEELEEGADVPFVDNNNDNQNQKVSTANNKNESENDNEESKEEMSADYNNEDCFMQHVDIESDCNNLQEEPRRQLTSENTNISSIDQRQEDTATGNLVEAGAEIPVIFRRDKPASQNDNDKSRQLLTDPAMDTYLLSKRENNDTSRASEASDDESAESQPKLVRKTSFSSFSSFFADVMSPAKKRKKKKKKNKFSEVPMESEGSNNAWIKDYYDAGAERHPDWDVESVTDESFYQLFCDFIGTLFWSLRQETDVDSDSESDIDNNSHKRNNAPIDHSLRSNQPLDDTSGHHHKQKRPLSAEDAELLRCIGLDSFMMLRFLTFGSDIAFWSLLVGSILLIPTYKAGGTAGYSGYNAATVINLEPGDMLHVMLVIYGVFQFSYILRRLWIEWEMFMPLRHDFLENGDFIVPKYLNQCRKTCIVEHVPHNLKSDKALYEFFNSIWPGSVHRAEVLLNSEHLSHLLAKRKQHIVDYENSFSQKVHQLARNYRNQHFGGKLRSGFKRGSRGVKKVHVEDTTNGRVDDVTGCYYRRILELSYHYDEIQQLDKEIEAEYVRLARELRRPMKKRREGRISKWLGLRYLRMVDTGSVHSSTAFVEFKSSAAKQSAIQCSLVGTADVLSVQPVPEVRDMIWKNAHVPIKLIETRKLWISLALCGILIGWSYIVTLIRRVENISTDHCGLELCDQPMVALILDSYLPTLVVEGLVRLIPFLLRFIVRWIRFKTMSDFDLYVLKWYFGFRLVTFVFVIMAGSLVRASDQVIHDPVAFIETVAGNVAEQSQVFIVYVIVAGGLQIFARISQVHNVLLHALLHRAMIEEATSERRLESLEHKVIAFHLDEFIPLFLFIFMVGGVYGWVAPVANLVVFGFFKFAYKVFKFMALYIYGNNYERGGFLFYTMTEMLFYIIYGMILIVIGYLSVSASPKLAGIFGIMLFLTLFVQLSINRTFVRPSRTLSLSKAASSDKQLAASSNGGDAQKERNEIGYSQRTRQSFKKNTELEKAAIRPSDFSEAAQVHQAVARMQGRYRASMDDDVVSMPELIGSGLVVSVGPAQDFFVYRQPSLNRATWESRPRPYRKDIHKRRADRIYDADDGSISSSESDYDISV